MPTTFVTDVVTSTAHWWPNGEDDDENVPDWDEDTDYLGEGSEPVQMDRYELERFLKRGGANTAATLEERDQLMRELEDETLTEMLGEVGGGYYDGR